MNQLEAEKTKETANIGNLTAINDDLAEIRDVYYSDSENFYVSARELGFAAPGEHFIRIIGLGGPEKSLISPGQIVSAAQPEYISEQIIQIFSFFMAITLLISIAAYDFLKNLKEREIRPAGYRYRV